DRLVADRGGIDHKRSDANELLVGPRLPKGFAARERLAPLDVESFEVGVAESGLKKEGKERERESSESVAHEEPLRRSEYLAADYEPLARECKALDSRSQAEPGNEGKEKG